MAAHEQAHDGTHLGAMRGARRRLRMGAHGGGHGGTWWLRPHGVVVHGAAHPTNYKLYPSHLSGEPNGAHSWGYPAEDFELHKGMLVGVDLVKLFVGFTEDINKPFTKDLLKVCSLKW